MIRTTAPGETIALDEAKRDVVPIARWMFLALEVIGAAAGFAPLAFFLGRPYLTLFFAIVAGLSGLISLRNVHIDGSPQVAWAEILLALAEAISKRAIRAVMGLLLYGIVYWLVRGIVFAASLGGWNLGLPAQSFGFWVVVPPLTVMVLVSAGRTIREMREQLLPTSSGEPSEFRKLASRRPNSGAGTAIGVVSLLAFSVAWFISHPGAHSWMQAFLEAVLWVVTIPASPPRANSDAGGLRTTTAKAVASLLDEIGFSIREPLKTGRSNVDPFFADIDLIASKQGLDVLVQVQISNQSTAPSWRSVSALQAASLIFGQEPGAAERIECLLVIVDGQRDQAAIESARQHKVRIFEMTASQVEGIGKSNAEEMEKSTAQLEQVLRVSRREATPA